MNLSALRQDVFEFNDPYSEKKKIINNIHTSRIIKLYDDIIL